MSYKKFEAEIYIFVMQISNDNTYILYRSSNYAFGFFLGSGDCFCFCK